MVAPRLRPAPRAADVPAFLLAEARTGTRGLLVAPKTSSSPCTSSSLAETCALAKARETNTISLVPCSRSAEGFPGLFLHKTTLD